MKTKNSWTLQKCRLLVKWPGDDVWYHAGPANARTRPVTMMTRNAAMVSTPNT